MRAWIWKVAENLRWSYWFVPALMALAAALAAGGMITLDRLIPGHVVERVAWLLTNEPAGARALLQTIAGSIITVAGVSFSITIASVATATAQFGPRLILNFMNDRGNQVTFGAFVATFVYCLLVLRTVQGANGDASGDAFVPHIAVIGGLCLALGCLGVLIYFIHHIPESIHISRMIARVGRELDACIDSLYPEPIGAPFTAEPRDCAQAPPPPGPLEDAVTIRAPTTGFIQHIEDAQLMEAARGGGFVVWTVTRPGDFVSPRTVIAAAKSAGLVSPRAIRQIQGAFIIGDSRTPSQDVLFPINQLVEVAARALSPGINDPFTAMECINWLLAGLGKLAERADPAQYRADAADEPRVVAAPVYFDTVADAMFGQLRPYVQGDRNAALYMANALLALINVIDDPDKQGTLRRHFDELATGFRRHCSHEADLAALDNLVRGDARFAGILAPKAE